MKRVALIFVIIVLGKKGCHHQQSKPSFTSVVLEVGLARPLRHALTQLLLLIYGLYAHLLLVTFMVMFIFNPYIAGLYNNSLCVASAAVSEWPASFIAIS
jgi:hypothetical protein